MAYPREPYCVGQEKSVLHSNRAYDKTVGVKPNLPGNVIVIHGVNDVGVSFEAVEKGLCQGLDARLLGIVQGKVGVFTPATYRMPGNKPDQDDKQTVEPDPDAVFFKRQINKTTHSPVIPFYWGFRESSIKPGRKMASVSTSSVTGSIRTCPRAAGLSAMRQARCRTCGTEVCFHRKTLAAIRCAHF